VFSVIPTENNGVRRPRKVKKNSSFVACPGFAFPRQAKKEAAPPSQKEEQKGDAPPPQEVQKLSPEGESKP